MDVLLQDLRYAVRNLVKNPAFTVVALLTLTLGIGANTATFSVLQGVVLSPLPYHQPARLVVVWENIGHIVGVSDPNFRNWQRTAKSFERMAGLTKQSYDLTAPGSAEHLNGLRVSSGFFSTLGERPSLGREFSAQEDQRGGAPVAMIGNRLWRERFGSSPSALGKSITLGGVDYTVIGVLSPEFHVLDEEADIYTPLEQGDPVWVTDRSVHALMVIGRLKPGASISQGQQEMSAVQANLDRLYPNLDRGVGTTIVPLKDQLIGDLSGTLVLLMGAVGLVLLIACANVANLLLARSTGRAREFAIHAALGASRARIVRQLITESVLLALVGGALGILAAKWGVRLVVAAISGTLLNGENIGLSAPALFFTLGLSIAAGILFGLTPALKSRKTELQTSLKGGTRASSGSQHRVQSALVLVQMALTAVLLAGAGLLLRTIGNLWRVNPGFNAQNLITFKVGGSPAAHATPGATQTAYRQLVERIRRIPGVQAADLTALVPLSPQDNSGPFWVGSQTPPSLAQMPRCLFYWTGPDYLRTMGIPLLRGRFFTAEDTTETEPVIVIDEVMAKTYFRDQDPVGQTLLIPHLGTVRIIGVVGHVKHWGLDDSSRFVRNQTYSSLYQLPDRYVSVFYSDVNIAVRTPLPPATMVPPIKSAIYGAGDKEPVYGIHTMREIVSESMAGQRLPMMLLGAFAALALALAGVGIYGMISYSVAQRVRELGLRMALGAQRSDVLRMIIGQAFGLAALGLGIGAAAAVGLSRILSSFSHLLYGVKAGDPFTFAWVSFFLIAVAILASYIPARRATRLDPMVALRHE